MPTRVCPTCGQRFRYDAIATHPFYPFCSERCRLAELNAWLDERYVIERPLSEDDLEDQRRAARGEGAPADDEEPTKG